MTAALRPVLAPGDRPETLTQRVYEAIRAAIVNQELASGSRLTEAGLARQLNVSKTPVREALLQLREVGLIEPDEHRGGRIVRPSRQAIADAYEVREGLEVVAAKAVARRAGQPAVREIRRLATESLWAARAGDLEAFHRWDEAFHRAIARATGNSRLAELIEHSLALVSALRERDAPGPADSVTCATSHVRVARAIGKRDAEGAGAAMADHVKLVAGLVLAAYEGRHDRDRVLQAEGAGRRHGSPPRPRAPRASTTSRTARSREAARSR
jgi:DNA-binding GntR family transcriptional regulator